MSILDLTTNGLYCKQGQFYLDPVGKVDKALIDLDPLLWRVILSSLCHHILMLKFHWSAIGLTHRFSAFLQETF